MARSILGIKTAGSAGDLRTAPAGSRSALDGAALQARLRQKRSPAYIEAMTRLDAGTQLQAAHAAQATQGLLDAIRQELPDVAIDALPLGIVAKCHLGAPHEVHTLTCAGNIIQHFKTGEALPPLMERARALAQHPGYAFIEVYPTRLITVSASGQTAVIDI
ncbi:hypothetical protein [Comamonas antarctica]|uniref:Uncharacterized protein n=1 Tax=Comamonas antarctica TaxID=2743470 RepID=A0A6N1XAY3_9BURK|nr:hypothetical protein [Comamonas antarctica]QKV55242.1 hypothetical protein HUK68_20095 [Comamonas antarctica]